jgi:hypothetical protein
MVLSLPAPDLVPIITSFPGTHAPWLLVASLNQPLDLWADRDASGKVRLTQVLAGTPVRDRSGKEVSYSSGLPAFVEITIANRRTGKTVDHERLNYCPNVGAPASVRVDEINGSASDAYPASCGHPFALSVRWGINTGWAATIPWALPSLPAGRYTLRVTVNAVHEVLESRYQNDSVVRGFAVVTRTKRTLRGSSTVRTSRLQAVLAEVSTLVPATPRTPSSAVAAGSLANLVALPADSVRAFAEQRHWYVSFGAGVYNAGNAPLILAGTRTGMNRMQAHQEIRDPRGQVAKLPVGAFVYDTRDGHDHWHFNRFARYDLIDRHGSIVRRSSKVGFCLDETDPFNLRLAGAPFVPSRPDGTGSVTDCGGRGWRSVRMQLDPGWVDEYGQNLPGQAFDVTSLPTGTYWIRITLDARHVLRELTRSDDVSWRRFRLIRRGTRALRIVVSRCRVGLTIPRQCG